MADLNLKWDPSKFRAQFADGLDANLGKAATLLKTEVKSAISIQGAPIAGKKVANRNSKTGRKMQARQPSKPGEPPHKFTGRLYRAVKSKVMKRKGKARVGVRGGNLTEFGTKNMAPRPYLRTTLARMKNAIAAVLTTPIITR